MDSSVKIMFLIVYLSTIQNLKIHKNKLKNIKIANDKK